MRLNSKKSMDIGMAYIIMIVLGIIGAIIIIYVLRGNFGQLGEKLLAMMRQSQPQP